jgi:hypothetical protein
MIRPVLQLHHLPNGRLELLDELLKAVDLLVSEISSSMEKNWSAMVQK